MKRNKHIIPLSKDHHFTLLFCWKIRQGLKLGVAANRMQDYARYFWSNDMLPHFEEEEVLLFSKVKDDLVDKALRDHAEIRSLIQQIESLKDEQELVDSLRLIADMVEAHIRFEERALFPFLEQCLSEDELQMIGAGLSKDHKSVESYIDPFWLENK